MEIAANTKISAIFKANPDAIEAIASINRHFEKLRNPILRKILASRVTIADAARIGGCTEEEFYKRLEPLGFTYTSKAEYAAKPAAVAHQMPLFLGQLQQESMIELDVCEDIATGNDPFLKIMDAVEQVNGSNALKLINSFEPTPLISILQKRGYTSYVEEIKPDLVHTYFWLEKIAAGAPVTPAPVIDFNVMVNDYEGRLRHLDVRHLEMPQPMIAILGELETLPPQEALHVTHRKVPQFLLPKLQERGFALALKEVGPNEVHLLIYKEN
ncbi:DUF2249 domain-containing protein [Pontibacter cellulosilyticus]|uniref:DUF2249 domain-containing protein n=1 Tax=Pontibacter cellulosilyticus TaxID=1720253 RepID=A0A923SK51_9BACT|nr:DUF2249 domain-containing protein [Pontibacter cellulosilyticus]MBC5994508.1 DUF2249 domain-containing protein [Pontibacter cellulosilyticus]